MRQQVTRVSDKIRKVSKFCFCSIPKAAKCFQSSRKQTNVRSQPAFTLGKLIVLSESSDDATNIRSYLS